MFVKLQNPKYVPKDRNLHCLSENVNFIGQIVFGPISALFFCFSFHFIFTLEQFVL